MLASSGTVMPRSASRKALVGAGDAVLGTHNEAGACATTELAFYDAICQNDSAVLELGDDTLKPIADELVGVVRRNATIDWDRNEQVRASLRRRSAGCWRGTSTRRTSRRRRCCWFQQAETLAADSAS